MFKRIFLIILDSVGIGQATDAIKFNDLNSNTFGHTVKDKPILTNFEKLGYYNLLNNTNNKTISYYTKAHPISNGKDTLTGHLEIMGVITNIAFKTFKDGFPDELLKEIELISNRKIIGNCSASGTEIIKELGERQMKTGELIVYTSADSVLQIAAHEEIIPLEELYEICSKVRELTLKEEWKVGRIIARPYIGTSAANFTRTSNRHDYALNPTSNTVLDNLKNNNYEVISIGKISDIFNNCGITTSIKTKDNEDGINKIIDSIKKDFNGLCFANLNDYDSKYGHRRDKEGYFKALKDFDDKIPDIINYLKYDDLLIITADHGNDPTYTGTDHTRENIPVVFYSKKFVNNERINDLNSFSDIGATIATNFNVEVPYGKSILDKLK